MKIFKILPVLAAAALLTGCNLANSGSSIKPSKYKKEATHAEIYEAYQTAFENSGVPSTPDPVDFSYKGASKYIVDARIERNGVVKAAEKITEIVESLVEFDKDSLVAHTKLNGSLRAEMNNGYGSLKYDMKQSAKNESYAQEVEKEAGYELTVANLSQGDYNSSTNTSAVLYGQLLSATFSNSSYNMVSLVTPDSYASMSNEEKANFKFYKDGNVLTQVSTFENTSSTETKETKYHGESIAQFEIKDKKLNYYVEIHQVEQETYLEDYSDYLEGDVLIDDMVMAAKGTFNFNELSLEMTDLSKLGTTSATRDVNSMFNLDLGL